MYTYGKFNIWTIIIGEARKGKLQIKDLLRKKNMSHENKTENKTVVNKANNLRHHNGDMHIAAESSLIACVFSSLRAI